MMSYARTKAVSPVGFIESRHHWVFKYWTGSAVEKAQQIVREICEENNLSRVFPSGKIRTEYATCAVKHDFDIFCRCCAVSNVTQTLVRIVGNFLATLCDYDEYAGGGIDYLEALEDVAGDNYEALELSNLNDILSNTYTWVELVRRIYSRRHWAAVRELGAIYVRKWVAFFGELGKRKEPFNDQERSNWNDILFNYSPSEIHEGSFLYSRSRVDAGAYKNACDALEFTETKRSQESILLILRERLRSEIHGKWAETSSTICRRRRFIDSIVDVREKQRRAINMIRLMENPDCTFLRSPPVRMTLNFHENTPDHFSFPQRELQVCRELAASPRFEAEAYWPIYTSFSGEYYHCILQLDGIDFASALQTIFLSVGQLSRAVVKIGGSTVPIDQRSLAVFYTKIERNTVDMIVDIVAEYAASLMIPVRVEQLELNQIAIVQLCADSIDEQECRELCYN